MFIEKKMYKEKLEDAVQAFETLVQGRPNMLSRSMKTIDISELSSTEKQVLLAVLFQLAEEEGEYLNDMQRQFLSNMQKHLSITSYNTTVDYMVIEEFSDLNVQKLIMRIALEFLYLQDGDELSDEQVEFLDVFSVNKYQAAIIKLDVIRQFHFIGVNGLKDKYSCCRCESALTTLPAEPTTFETAMWDSIKKYCLEKENIGEVALNLWIESLEPISIDNHVASFLCKYEFQRDVIIKNYKETLKKALREVCGFDCELCVITENSLSGLSGRH